MRPPEELPVKRTAECVHAQVRHPGVSRFTVLGLASVRESDLVSYVAKVDRKQVPPR